MMSSVRFWAFSLVVLAADQVTKSWAQGHATELREHPVMVLDFIDGPEAFLEFTYITNPGAAWSMFSDFPGVLTVLAFVALISIYFFRHSLELEKAGPQTIFGLISGGIAGNLCDRLFRTPAEVVDFLDVYLPILDYDYPIFNLADSFIFLGVFSYVIRGFREAALEKKSALEPEFTNKFD
jgi:signal peptidase II